MMLFMINKSTVINPPFGALLLDPERWHKVRKQFIGLVGKDKWLRVNDWSQTFWLLLKSKTQNGC